jgi:hypothetical protein
MISNREIAIELSEAGKQQENTESLYRERQL